VSDASPPDWAAAPRGQFATVARNLSTRYMAIGTEMVIGLLLLPFNLARLGPAEYGLWILLGSVTVHFSLLELGFGSGLVKFVAQYRAHRDARALNEIASTLFWVFALLGLVAYALVIAVAFNLQHLFALTPEQAHTGRWVLLITGTYVTLNFPFSVYGGIISGFQRYDVNNGMAIAAALGVAITNVGVLSAGYGLVTLVAATTTVRVLAYAVYRRNAYRVFPDLRIRPSLFRRARLREVTGFSIYASIINWANKLNYQVDQIVIGVFLGSAAVAVWAPAERIISSVQRLTNQLNGVLFPAIVDSDASRQQRRLQEILLQGTRLSLAMVVPLAAALIVLADPLLRAWLRGQAETVAGAIPVIQVLAIGVAIRVGNATGTTLLKGTGRHRMLAFVNLGTAVVNVTLSIVLIQRFGLIGVAWGTLVPIAFSAVFILFPAACRRVGVPVSLAVRQAVLPAVWPAFVVGGLFHLTRGISAGTLLAVGLHAAAGVSLYLTLFLTVAISRADRAYYIARLTQLTRRRRPVPAGPAVRPAGTATPGSQFRAVGTE
jgi:O-antigen/teichoic acid export membrane protein